MCGICGIVGRDRGALPIDPAALRRMTDAITHRGPDEEGHVIEAGVALGARRLSIIDVQGSHQPVENEIGSVVAVFNGEIYNFKTIRADLRARGHELKTEGDTETLVHLYEDYGTDFVQHISGMFSVAIWDKQRERLVLARDRLGIKPLYIAETKEGVAFASEVKSLLAAGIIDAELDAVSAELFLAYGYVPGPRSMFAGVEKVPPATVVVVEGGQIVSRITYWRPAEVVDRDDDGATWEEDRERLLELLRAAVRSQMVSDVPLGIMLSGGLDSTIVATLMAEMSTRPIKTFSVGFSGRRAVNELDDARLVANRLGAEHHELVVEAAPDPSALDRALWHLEDPVADVSCLGLLLISDLARTEVTVALSGQGADELLGGYRKHQVAALSNYLQRYARPALPALMMLGERFRDGTDAHRALVALSTRDPVTRLLASSRIVTGSQRSALMTRDFLLKDGEDLVRATAERACPARSTPLRDSLEMDRALALVDNILLYFDKISMAASLEVRVPFLDDDLVSFCSSLPDARCVTRLRRKELLRSAARGLIPDSVLEKPKKGFFNAAASSWVQANMDGLVTSVILDDRTRVRGQIDIASAKNLMAHVRRGAGKKQSQALLALVLLEKWQRIWVDGDGIPR
jgi:asparagine synthase (glutamine-hydrolysing)